MEGGHLSFGTRGGEKMLLSDGILGGTGLRVASRGGWHSIFSEEEGMGRNLFLGSCPWWRCCGGGFRTEKTEKKNV